MSYYFIYVLKKSELIAGFSVALSLGMLLANALAAFLMVRMDKKWVGVLTSICQAMCCILFFIIGEKDIVNIENLKNLNLCGTDLFWFSCFPLKVENCDGSPIRAVAWFEQ